ncbi:MAG: tyrosine-type recombinase/integrase [Sulfuricellaceae bacterium]|nr:tyrosine-type recombinase/integrase [Sulfuricellaceae bacterium]
MRPLGRLVERAERFFPLATAYARVRHTFASRFMMNGGNILVLQKLLGHRSLTMTIRYAHLAPDHLQEAKILNPLMRLTVGRHMEKQKGLDFHLTPYFFW